MVTVLDLCQYVRFRNCDSLVITNNDRLLKVKFLLWATLIEAAAAESASDADILTDT